MHCSTHSFSPITCLYLSVCVVWLREGARGRESEAMCVFMCVCECEHTCIWECMCKCVCVRENVCLCLILLPLFPLRISCIIYGPLMNMLISQCAGRGERASPILFLHSSDERGKERGMEKREREKLGKCALLLERKGNQWTRGERRRAEKEKRCKESMWKYIYEIPGVRQISIVAIWTVASPCCAILCWRQMNHPCWGDVERRDWKR